MTDQTKDLFVTLQAALLRCWIFGFVLLLIWFAAMQALPKSILEIHEKMFGLTIRELEVVFYCGMGLLKLTVITLFFIPWLAIKLVVGSSD